MTNAVFGGRHHIYHQQIDTFFRPLRDAGVKLVFMCGNKNGRKDPDKTSVGMIGDNRYYKQTISILNAVKTHQIVQKRNFFRSLMGLYSTEIAKKYGEFRCRKVGEYFNKTCVEYARSVNAIAILGADNDFMLYDMGVVQYWNYGVNFMIFDQIKEKQRLGFDDKQYLLMVGILVLCMKNGKVRKSFIRSGLLYNTPRQTWNSQIIQKVIDAIQRIGPTANFEQVANDLGQRALGEAAADFQRHYDRYDMQHENNTLEEPLSAPEYQLVQSHMLRNHALYDLWIDSLIHMNLFMVNVEEIVPDATPYPRLFINLHLRAAGVMLNHLRDDENVERTFVLRESVDVVNYVREKVVSPPATLSVLDIFTWTRIMDGVKFDNATEKLKWSAFMWIINVEPKHALIATLLCIPPDILPAAITALFLLKVNVFFFSR